ncbi:MAG: transposase [Acidobacteriota bacterium]|nr:transposase [Acidobacteriota bacterium]
MTYYERRLPHWFPQGKALFVTWRLWGSLPRHVLARLKTEPKAKAWSNATPRGQECPRHRVPSAGECFLNLDRALDRARSGPRWLTHDRVAASVIRVFRRGEELRRFRLAAFVIMPNHVHILMEPFSDTVRTLKAIKGASGRMSNLILGRAGRRFWQEESFDHWVRNAAEFERIRAYIEGNPVRAGLVQGRKIGRGPAPRLANAPRNPTGKLPRGADIPVRALVCSYSTVIRITSRLCFPCFALESQTDLVT